VKYLFLFVSITLIFLNSGCDNSTEPKDCAGVSGGNALIDDCGVCISEESGLTENYLMDCAGICAGISLLDNCGICDDDESNDCLEDCANVWGGIAIVDDCGVCSGGDTGQIFNSDDLGCGCFNPAQLTYCYDADNDLLGSIGSEIDYCLQDLPEGWVLDCTDEDDTCMSNTYDCFEECDGLAFINDCGECVGGSTEFNENYKMDCSGICFGNSYLDDCDVCDDDPANDNADMDCYGTCFGSHVIDDCNECVVPFDFNHSIDCNGDCNGNAVENECGCVEGNTGFIFDFCYGCTDQIALNYDESSTIDDGSCEYASNCWDIDPAQYGYNGSITAMVEIGGFPVGSEEDCVAAFVGDEVRGVMNGLYFPPDDSYLFMITVYSNSSSGDILDFKYYSVENDEVYNLNEEVEFQVNMFVGDPVNPFILNGSPNVESYFSWNQSSLQAFYFIQAATINGNNITTDDWIAVFKNDVCTGAAQWTGEYTVVSSMGDDGFDSTNNYMISGDIPQFRVYDSNENIYYDALPNEEMQNIGWSNLSSFNITLLIAE
jgi:hypothetical protein